MRVCTVATLNSPIHVHHIICSTRNAQAHSTILPKKILTCIALYVECTLVGIPKGKIAIFVMVCISSIHTYAYTLNLMYLYRCLHSLECIFAYIRCELFSIVNDLHVVRIRKLTFFKIKANPIPLPNSNEIE